MSRSVRVMNWRRFRAMPLYLQFVVGLMVAYAAGMSALTVLLVVGGTGPPGVTLGVAAFVWLFALLVVPSVLGQRYVEE